MNLGVLIIPICSMRSHVDDRYALTKDGNIQLHLARAHPGSIILVPANNSDIDTLKALHPDITFIELNNYPVNALAVRETFWKQHKQTVIDLIREYNIDTVVTDITNSGLQSVVPTLVYNFNITGGDPTNPREYIDKFLLDDVYSVNNSSYTSVLNESQRDILIKHGADGNKIMVDRRVIRPDMYAMYRDRPDNSYFRGIFHPFRISDTCYRFDKVLEDVARIDGTVTITDPNDSYYGSQYEKLADRLGVDVHVVKYTKDEYYQVLGSQPTIFYYEDPNKVFHPGLAELIYFKCNIVSPYKLPDIKELLLPCPDKN